MTKRAWMILGLIGCLASAPALADDTRLECTLFGAVLQEQQAGGSDVPLYVATQTGAMMIGLTPDRLKEQLPSIEEETIHSFKDINQQSVTVDCASVLPAGRNVIVTDETMAGGTSKWTLSRAGVNSTRSQALLYAGYFCGPLCGGGTLYLLELKDGKWLVKERAMVWIS